MPPHGRLLSLALSVLVSLVAATDVNVEELQEASSIFYHLHAEAYTMRVSVETVGMTGGNATTDVDVVVVNRTVTSTSPNTTKVLVLHVGGIVDSVENYFDGIARARYSEVEYNLTTDGIPTKLTTKDGLYEITLSDFRITAKSAIREQWWGVYNASWSKWREADFNSYQYHIKRSGYGRVQDQAEMIVNVEDGEVVTVYNTLTRYPQQTTGYLTIDQIFVSYARRAINRGNVEHTDVQYNEILGYPTLVHWDEFYGVDEQMSEGETIMISQVSQNLFQVPNQFFTTQNVVLLVMILVLFSLGMFLVIKNKCCNRSVKRQVQYGMEGSESEEELEQNNAPDIEL